MLLFDQIANIKPIIFKSGTTPSSLNVNTKIVNDSTLKGNYDILSYNISSKSNVLVSSSTNVAHIYISNDGIYINVTNTDLAGCPIEVVLIARS